MQNQGGMSEKESDPMNLIVWTDLVWTKTLLM